LAETRKFLDKRRHQDRRFKNVSARADVGKAQLLLAALIAH
jgi:hypothetical protein